MSKPPQIVPGSRILVRDEQWRVARVEQDYDTIIHAVGISPLVQDQQFSFVLSVEVTRGDIEIVDPKLTKFEADTSANARRSRLYLESILATTPATEETAELIAEDEPETAKSAGSMTDSGDAKHQGIHHAPLTVGHRGALDVHDWQLRPAALALSRPRHSVLIADAVGMGKTIEAGVLLSELIRRGKGDRILIVTLKSLLQQFQSELWQRFSIPFARLDSQRIQRIQSQIPTYHNPFHTYPRAIISIDTLKNSARYRAWLEKTEWDAVVIDECQHVAARAQTRSSRSQRSRLAELLSQQTDTLIMLSATPHDGKAKSFASLLNMLEPTAVSNPEDYDINEVQDLVIRRFKKDVENVDQSFQKRELRKILCDASPEEEAALEALESARFSTLDNPRAKAGNRLFATTLLKSFLSSPAACLETLGNRDDKVRRKIDRLNEELETGMNSRGKPSTQSEDTLRSDIHSLNEDREVIADLQATVSTVDETGNNTRLTNLLEVLENADWSEGTAGQRVVLFSERIATLEWLREVLAERFGLDEDELPLFTGSLSDVEQAEMIEKFGQSDSNVRLLLASDAASEGVNLHYNCNHLVHYDIPWSIITFEQRNGRIDRMGQKKTPYIDALVLQANSDAIKADTWILDKLVDKGEVVSQNLGDPRLEWHAFGVDDVIDAESETERFEEEFERSLEEDSDDISTSQPLGGFDLSRFLDPSTHDDSEETDDTDSATLRSVNHDSVKPQKSDPFSLFSNTIDWLLLAREALTDTLNESAAPFDIQRYEDAADCVDVIPGDSMARWLKRYADLPATRENFRLRMTTDRQRVMDSLDRALNEGSSADREEPWQLLWEMHPVVAWIQEQLVTSFARGTSPAVTVRQGLDEGEKAWAVLGHLSNNRAQPRVSQLVLIKQKADGTYVRESARAFFSDIHFYEDAPLVAPQAADTEALEDGLSGALDHAHSYFLELRKKRGKMLREPLLQAIADINRWADERTALLESEKDEYDADNPLHKHRIQARDRDIIATRERQESMHQWIKDVMSVDERSLHLQPICGFSR